MATILITNNNHIFMILSVKILLCNIIILDQTVMKNIPAIITKRNFQKWKKTEKVTYRKSIAYHVFFFGAKIQKCSFISHRKHPSSGLISLVTNLLMHDAIMNIWRFGAMQWLCYFIFVSRKCLFIKSCILVIWSVTHHKQITGHAYHTVHMTDGIKKHS